MNMDSFTYFGYEKKINLTTQLKTISDTESDTLPYWFGVFLPRIGEYSLPNEEVLRNLHVLLLSF